MSIDSDLVDRTVKVKLIPTWNWRYYRSLNSSVRRMDYLMGIITRYISNTNPQTMIEENEDEYIITRNQV